MGFTDLQSVYPIETVVSCLHGPSFVIHAVLSVLLVLIERTDCFYFNCFLPLLYLCGLRSGVSSSWSHRLVCNIVAFPGHSQ